MSVKPFLTMLVIVFLTDTVMFTTNSSSTVVLLDKVTIIGIAIYSLCVLFRQRVVEYRGFLSIFCIVCSYVTMFVNSDSFSPYGLQTCITIISLIVAYSYSIEDFAFRYLCIIRIIAVVSLVTFIFGKVIVGIKFLPRIVSITGIQYVSLFFSNVCTVSLNRNFGPFWEPGAYQLYLLLALVFRYFVLNDDRKLIFDTMIFSIALITTFSTTGILGLLVFFLYVLIRKHNFGLGINLGLFVIVISGCLYILLDDYAYQLIFGKLSQGLQRASVQSRYYSLVGCLKVFLQHPIFGAGEKTGEIISGMFGLKVSMTGTIFINFAEYGFCYGIIKLGLLIGFCKDISKDIVDFIFCFTIIFIALFGENFTISLVGSSVILLRKQCKENGVPVKNSDYNIG